MRSILPAVQELERCFEEFKPLFPDCDFPKPVIAIQSKGRKNALGWFVGDKWVNGTEESIAEITISAEHLKGTGEQVAEVLLHEMCHYANKLHGIKDCTVNQYHNAHFRRQAESIGLVVTKGPRGWAYTELGPELLETVKKAQIDPEAFGGSSSIGRYGGDKGRQSQAGGFQEGAAVEHGRSARKGRLPLDSP
jgi:hypothetical protein